MPEFEGSKGFQLKSGNKTPFKMMGSSPVKDNGEVTPRTDRQANRLVEKRTKIRNRRDKIEQREKEGKKVFLKNLRKKRLDKREERVQDKIDKNPTAQSWRNKKKPDGGKPSLDNAPKDYLTKKRFINR